MTTSDTKAQVHPKEPRKKTLTYQGLAKSWYARTKAVEKAHFHRTVAFRDRHNVLGVFSVILTSLLGALSALEISNLISLSEIIKEKKVYLQASIEVLLVILSVSAPVVTALVAFLKLEDKSSAHHDAAAQFAALKRKMLLLIIKCKGDSCNGSDLEKTFDDVRQTWDELTAKAPALYRKEWDKEIRKYEYEVEH